ncbi:MAG: hypothetical protein DRN27_09110 [Thermoplasmata archaeon]|nr:MAG: hypothetical protein DRN27_09110 [Thermoplasmata archaeon]
MIGDDLDPRIKNTFYLLFGTIVYLAVISFFLFFLTETMSGTEILFALTLLPLLAIFVMVWGYGMKLRMPGLELEYFPVEKSMRPPTIIKENTTAKEAEGIMKKGKIDFLNILDENGFFSGIVTKADILKVREKGKMISKVRDFMTKREKIVHAFEREDLKSVMKKIGQSKHSRLPVLDKNNRLLGIVDSVEISDMLSKLL